MVWRLYLLLISATVVFSVLIAIIALYIAANPRIHPGLITAIVLFSGGVFYLIKTLGLLRRLLAARKEKNQKEVRKIYNSVFSVRKDYRTSGKSESRWLFPVIGVLVAVGMGIVGFLWTYFSIPR